jgi:hypothetical protein
MLGQAEREGKLNPETGHAAEAVLPLYQSPLDQFGARGLIGGTYALPANRARVAAGIRANARNRFSDGLMEVSHVPSEINIYQMPTIIVSYQLPNNHSQQGQSRRLPTNMVAPQLAWSPG